MRSQYFSDVPEHADPPRRDYMKMDERKKSSNPSQIQAKSKLRLQQQMAQNRRTTNNSDDSEDDRICEIDKRIAARKAAALAEDKAANDPSQYVSNRAKMIKDQSSNSPGNLCSLSCLDFEVQGASSPPRQPRQLPWLIFETTYNKL